MTPGRRWYHGGVPGLRPGDLLRPSPPHVTDGCPVCVARAEGRALTVGQYRAWLRGFGDRARPVLDALAGAPDAAPLDPPSARAAVYITTHQGYAAWYAARSGNGDLYEVAPVGELKTSEADRFPSATVAAARVVRVVRRSVRLTRHERRALDRDWRLRDELAES